MPILVSGGAGFIGSHVCKSLLSAGETVICVDDLNDYYDPSIKRMRLRGLEDKNCTFYQIDIRDRAALESIFFKHKIDSVIHLAARAGVRESIKHPDLYSTTNITGTANLLSLSKGAENFVFGSSSSVYGNNSTPFHEEQDCNNTLSPYAATKRAGEIACKIHHELHGTPITCLRFFTVYGPMGRPDMAAWKFTEAVCNGKPITRYGNGNSARDYTYITDIIDGVLAALDKPMGFETINLGDSRPIKLNKFISIIEKTLGKKAIIKESQMQEGDAETTYADISKARKLLGFKPKIGIEEGMQRFAKWYKGYAKGL
jgi:UDP-glucuronate 4-epimerase